MIRQSLFIAALSLLVPTAPSRAQQYDIVEVEVGGQHQYKRGVAINNRGWVLTEDVWIPGGSSLHVPGEPGQQIPHFFANGMNSQGVLVGRDQNSGAVVVDQSGVHPLAAVGRRDWAYDINDDWVVVGASDMQGVLRPTVWWFGVGLDLGVLAGFPLAGGEAYAVNRRGVIVGWSLGIGGHEIATMWVDQRIVDLGTLGYSSLALDINDHDQVVGVSRETLRKDPRPFFWESGVMRELPAPSKQNVIVSADAINNYSEIIGNGVSPLVYRLGRLRKLQSFLAADDWEVLTAYDINDRGEILCNARRTDDPHGLHFPVVVVPRFSVSVPEPKAGGLNTLRVVGAFKHDDVTVVYGRHLGTTTIPGGKCAGTTIDLAGLFEELVVRTNGLGRADTDVRIPAKLKHKAIYMQAIDSDCQVSEPIEVVF